MATTIPTLLAICLLCVLHTSFSLPITSDVKMNLDSEQKTESELDVDKKFQDVQVKSLGGFLGRSFDEGKVREVTEIRRMKREIMTGSVLCAEGMIQRIGRCWTPEEFEKVFGDDAR